MRWSGDALERGLRLVRGRAIAEVDGLERGVAAHVVGELVQVAVPAVRRIACSPPELRFCGVVWSALPCFTPIAAQ